MLRLGMERMGRKADDPLIDEYYDALLYHYARDIDSHTRLYDGAMEAVEALKARDYLVAICTNKPEGLAHELLTRLGIRDDFAAMLGADTLPVRKPDPEHLWETVRRAGGDPAQCLLVGDSDTDRNTSKAAGVASVLVTFGPAGGDMAALAPEALLDRYSDLPDLVEKLLGKA
jgi:phosphoglycolate phosphatase